MFRLRFLLASLLFTSAFTACTDDDEIWMPPGGTGKADGVQLIKGSDIPSQYVDNGKHYLTGRQIVMLEQVGALHDIGDMVAKRADGIIANLPANGRLEAAELVRLENPQIFATLFPEEKAELPKLWGMLLGPNPNPTTVGVPTNDLTITEQVTQPSGLTVPTFLLISSLPAEQQPAAKRVQLVFNGDNNANTIQVADIDKVLQDPQAFTPAEVTQLNATKALFHERATSVEEAKAQMPKPGHTDKVTTFGQMSLELTSDVVLHEHRQIYNYSNPSNWTVTLMIEQTKNITLHAPASDKVLAIALDTGAETIYNGADIVYGDHPVGNVVIERYNMGERKETHELALPPFTAGTENTPANNVIDFQLFTGNQTLYKNAYEHLQANYWVQVDSRYETTMNPSPTVPQSVIDQLATQKSSLPTGRYEIQTSVGALALDLYPEGVVIAHMNTITSRLLPEAASLRTFSAAVGNYSVSFVPLTNRVSVNGAQPTILTPAHRTK